MENEVGAQVAYFSNPFPHGGFSQPRSGDRYNGHVRNAGWNVNSWDWDSVMFKAKPVEENRLGKSSSNIHNIVVPSGNLSVSLYPSTDSNKRKQSSEEEDAGNLTLKLGGSSYGDDSNSKNNKRFRSGSAVTSYPSCQVDNCRTDLTAAKDYHRRHKVCEAHSKASKTLVGNIMQRFCQQCSRFHPLEEFDEGKRSCRRRLAGHNKRRRKTQPEESGGRGFLPEDVNRVLRNLDISALVTVLSRQLQANDTMEKLLGRLVWDQDYLVQCLSKLKFVSSSEDSRQNKMQTHQAIDLNISQDTQAHAPKQDARAQGLETNGPQSTAPNFEIVRMLSGLIQRSPEALSLLHGSLMGQQTPNFKSNDQPVNKRFPGIKPAIFAPEIVSGTAGLGVCHKVAESSTSRGGLGFPLHILDSSETPHCPNNVTLKQSFANCNPMEERLSSRSPSSSPPVVQKFFPLHSREDSKDNDSVSAGEEIELMPDESPSDDGHRKISIPNCGMSSDQNHFRLCSVRAGSDLKISGYTSSGSDQSPTSSNSDTQERTSRIIFKLFGKDPSDFPQMLRTQIFEWLSHIPSDMESYIRPGCVILTVFASMPSAAWDQLRGDLQERMKLLLSRDCSNDFWENGRIIVQAEQQFASLNSGKIQLYRSCRSRDAPKILSVRPIAVVAGEETRLIVTGYNLMVPGTKILCAYQGKYISEEVIPEDHQICSETPINKNAPLEHKFSGGPANVLGRLFVEVERHLKGNSFPVIVADSAICGELRSLEGDMDRLSEGVAIKKDSEMHSQANVQLNAHEDVVSFLNELGWLLQCNSYSEKKSVLPGVLPRRFKFLLTYAVERDWNFLLKRVLDMLFSVYAEEGSNQEALTVISEVNLLHRAVKRNCRRVVDMLLSYAYGDFAFSPGAIGPGSLTPLHIAASMQNAEDIVDALTSDPGKIGLDAWTTALDASQHTPHAYALMRNNHSYNRAVKGAGSDTNLSRQTVDKLPQKCGECARFASKRVSRMTGYHGAMYRPFVFSLLATAAVCVCVCLLYKGPPTVNSTPPFMWEKIEYGAI
ncbi:hypothetical protein SUGI_0047840 [Cryptomeria japonica]|nr:hypothetical protein SUGI_0047840 [Cryptomeria japonica]